MNNNFINRNKAFWQTLNLPKSCYLGTRITKKMLLENNDLSASDKRLISSDLAHLHWQYTLKTGTITIPPYQTNELDYGEIAILYAELRDTHRAKHLAEIIQRIIPYPVMLVITDMGRLRISLALKRQNLADKQKLTVESYLDTGWMSAEDFENHKHHLVVKSFLESLDSKQFNWENFYTFYLSLVERILAYNRALITEHYILNNQADCNKVTVLQEKIINYYRVLSKIEALRKQAAKSKQLSKQVDLNTQIHQLQVEANLLKQSL